jgi:hypothetical protein
MKLIIESERCGTVTSTLQACYETAGGSSARSCQLSASSHTIARVETPADPPAPAVEPRLRTRLRAKLPEMLLEAASVLLAVLLALAVDEWRENRSYRQLAERAERSILAELRANRDELGGAFHSNAERLVELQRTIDRLAADPGRTNAQVELTFVLAELSDAAWETTRATQATQFMDFAWLIEVARLYERQALYETTQLDMLERVRSAIGEFSTNRPPVEILVPVRARLQTFQALGEQLQRGYDEVLARRPPPGP